jgi:2-keto-4-pentenoate hydratase/2-oxohepta-3-ene-1,7-dioic acid hydratase in catechol pathway
MTHPMPQDVVPALAVPRARARRRHLPVHRIYCVGRNFADHAREMGATPPPKSERGLPTFFMKPADAISLGGDFPYPSSTAMLHHEVELVVAIGRDAPDGGVVAEADAAGLIFGYGVGLDLTRRDLQNAAKAKGRRGTPARASTTPRRSASWCPPRRPATCPSARCACRSTANCASSPRSTR